MVFGTSQKSSPVQNQPVHPYQKPNILSEVKDMLFVAAFATAAGAVVLSLIGRNIIHIPYSHELSRNIIFGVGIALGATSIGLIIVRLTCFRSKCNVQEKKVSDSILDSDANISYGTYEGIKYRYKDHEYILKIIINKVPVDESNKITFIIGNSNLITYYTNLNGKFAPYPSEPKWSEDSTLRGVLEYVLTKFSSSPSKRIPALGEKLFFVT